ncbi:MAG: hypothetical protein ACM3RX_04345, partial [Methanococcaceae archaeon]
MTSTTESGLAKLISNFDRLTMSVVKIGEKYNPSNPDLTPVSLQKASAESRSAMDETANASIVYRNAVKAREKAFEPLGGFATRLANTLKVSDKGGNSYEIAKTYLRKIQGRRAASKRTEAELKADAEAGIVYKEVSASQMGYENMAENFGMLVKLVTSIPAYQPNEEDMKSVSLIKMHEDLKSKNAAVVAATTDLFKAR